MAIKDWKKLSVPKYSLEKFNTVTTDMFERKSLYHIIKIDHRNDFKGTPYVVIIDDLNNVTNLATEYFKTRASAIKWAKSYMRTH